MKKLITQFAIRENFKMGDIVFSGGEPSDNLNIIFKGEFEEFIGKKSKTHKTGLFR